jgi:hypothetical protein
MPPLLTKLRESREMAITSSCRVMVAQTGVSPVSSQ